MKDKIVLIAVDSFTTAYAQLLLEQEGREVVVIDPNDIEAKKEMFKDSINKRIQKPPLVELTAVSPYPRQKEKKTKDKRYSSYFNKKK